MNTLIDKPRKAFHRDGRIFVSMESGLDFSFPIRGNQRLEGEPDHLLSNIEVSPFGLHWPDLDEDLSIRGILAGDYGQRHKGKTKRSTPSDSG
jgi:hypothetical protein